VLPQLVPANGRRQLAAGLLQGFGAAQPDGLLPGVPEGAAVRVLQRHEQRVVVEPGVLALAERLECLALGRGGTRLEALRRLRQQRHLGRDDRAVIDPPLFRAGRRARLLRVEPPLLGQPLQAEQVGVSGEGAERLVGAVTVARRAERHHLPQTLPGGLQEVDPLEGRGAQLADTGVARQRGGVQQDAGATVECHVLTSGSWG
jgi:hypothetical protein